MNILDVQDKLKNLSEQQLVQEMQMPSGSAPQFLVLSEMSRRKRMRDDLTSAQQAPQRTVAEDAVAAAGVPQAGLGQMARAMAPQTDVTQNTGIGSLMPQAPVQGMADGGEVGGPTVVRNGRRYTQLPNGMLIDAATGLPATPTSPQDVYRQTLIDAAMARPNVVRDDGVEVPPQDDFLLGAQGFERRTGLPADIDAYLARPASARAAGQGDINGMIDAMMAEGNIPAASMLMPPKVAAPPVPETVGMPMDYAAMAPYLFPPTGSGPAGAPVRDALAPADLAAVDEYLNPPVPAPVSGPAGGPVPEDESWAWGDFLTGKNLKDAWTDPEPGEGDWPAIPNAISELFTPDPATTGFGGGTTDGGGATLDVDTGKTTPEPATDDTVTPRLPGGPSGSGSGASAAPVSSYEQELIDAMKRSEKRATQDKWLALAQAGLALMSSAQPTLGGAIGEAGLQGLGAFREGRDTAEAERMKLLEAQYAVQMARQRAGSSGGGGGGGGSGLGDIKALMGLSASIGEQMAAMTDMKGDPIPVMQGEYERAAAAQAQLNNMIYGSLGIDATAAGATDDVDDVR
jgi:hypothetical protein